MVWINSPCDNHYRIYESIDFHSFSVFVAFVPEHLNIPIVRSYQLAMSGMLGRCNVLKRAIDQSIFDATNARSWEYGTVYVMCVCHQGKLGNWSGMYFRRTAMGKIDFLINMQIRMKSCCFMTYSMSIYF